MRNYPNQRPKDLRNPSDSTPLEDQVLGSLLYGLFVVPLLILVINIILRTGGFASFAAAFATVSFLVMNIAYRRRGNRPWIRRTTLLILLLLVIPSTFFSNAGLQGGFGYFMLLFGLVVVSSTREGPERTGFSIVYAVVVTTLVVADLTFLPEFYPRMDGLTLQIKRAYSLVLSAATVFILFHIYSTRYNREHERLLESRQRIEAYNSELFEQARIDSLTGVPNRRDAMEHLQAIIDIADRNDRDFALLLCDMDHFKHFNDEFGHDCGDYLLKEAARELRSSTRAQDFVARWGGEEFLIVLPETGLDGAVELAEKLRRQIESLDLVYAGTRHHLTITIGLTARRETLRTLEQYLKEADQALYYGKQSGRNRVIPAPGSGA